MPTDWRRLCREAGYRIGEGDELTIALTGERQHRVRVEVPDGRDLIRVWGTAARPSVLAEATDEPHVFAWQKNRASDLVGVKVDRRGRLIGEAWVPMAGLDAEEWKFWVRTVAETCDRLEYLMSGRDED